MPDKIRFLQSHCELKSVLRRNANIGPEYLESEVTPCNPPKNDKFPKQVRVKKEKIIINRTPLNWYQEN